MVKFGEILEVQLIFEWREHYVSYNRLKRIIKRCAFLRAQLLRVQAANHDVAADSDEEEVVDAMLDSSKKALEKIKRQHSVSKLSFGEQEERLAVLSLRSTPDSLAGWEDLEIGPSDGRPGDDPDADGEAVPLILPPPVLARSAASSKDRSLSSENQSLLEFRLSSATKGHSFASNALSKAKADAPLNSATFPLPLNPQRRRSSSVVKSSPVIVPVPVPKVPPKASPRPSSAKPKSSTQQSRQGSPLLRHIAAKAYDNYATPEELKMADHLESEVMKFWQQIEADLTKVDAFYEGKVTSCDMTLYSFFMQESAMGCGSLSSPNINMSPLKSSSGSIPSLLSERVRNLTLAGSAHPDLRSVKRLYIELMQLQNFVRLNGTGFRKIVKKFDKVMNRSTLPKFMDNLKKRQFMSSSKCIELIEGTTSLVSRDKLMDLKADAQAAIRSPRSKKNLGFMGERENDGTLMRGVAAFFASDKPVRFWALFLSVLLAVVAWKSAPFR